MLAPDTDLLSPAHLRRIEDLSLLARVVVDGAMPGIHRSLRQGRGSEFFQYRPYESGEDLKLVDWKVSLNERSWLPKLTKKAISIFCSFLIRVLPWVFSGEFSPVSKLKYASMLAACFAYLAYRQGDRVGVCLFDSVQNWIRPSSGSAHFGKMTSALSNLKPAGKIIMRLAGISWWQICQVRLWLCFSQIFWKPKRFLPERLRFSLSSKYEALCLQILDREEQELPKGDALRFVEMEGDQEISTSPANIRRDYQLKMEEFQSRLSENLSVVSAEFESFFTDQDLGFALRRFLGMRNQNLR